MVHTVGWGEGFSTTTCGLYSLDNFCNSASSSADAIGIDIDSVTDGADGVDGGYGMKGECERIWYDS